MWACVETQSCSFKKSVFKRSRDLEKARRGMRQTIVGSLHPTNHVGWIATALHDCMGWVGCGVGNATLRSQKLQRSSPTVEVAVPTLLRRTMRDVLPGLHHHHSSLLLKPAAKGNFKTYLVYQSIMTRNKLSTLTLQ